MIGALGKDVKKPDFILKKYSVFVQNLSTGCRRVHNNTTLLYEVCGVKLVNMHA